MSAALYTYTGVWINWSEGAIRGATLTLSQTDSGILSAFLAILVSLAGSLFWSILSFALHQTGTTAPDRRRDALHYQRQVILRNKGAAAAAWALIKLPFESGRTASKLRAVGRSLPLALLPILVLILFGVSGLFTSYITKAAGHSTLIIGPGCGGYSFNATDVTVSNTKSLQDTYDAATYVRRCYLENASELDCSTYVRPSLPFTTNPNASCPYSPDLCAYNGNSALQMDTGLLDSHEDFGVNAPPRNRIKYRRVTTCAPVKHGSGLGSVQNDSTWGQIVYINAGYQYYMGEPYLNYTFSYTPIPSVDGVGYTLSAVFAKSDPSGLLNGLESWKPTDAINQTDADITMMMLNQNNINYLQPSYDPWMTALEQQNYSIEGTNVTSSMWTKSYEVNLMVCTDQYQICNPNRPGPDGCTKLGGILSTSLSTFTVDPTKFLGFNVYQIATIGRFLSGNNDRSMYSNVNGRGGAALNASSIAYSNIQFYIPPTQWQTEVTTWFATSLAKEQAWAVEWATAPKNFPATSLLDQSSVGWNVTAPLSRYARVQCTNQLVHNAAGYANFSVLGLALTVGVCGLIIVVGLSVDSVVGWLRGKGHGRRRYMREQWAVEETLSLHRAAYVGWGVWRGDDPEGMVPSSVGLEGGKGGEGQMAAAGGEGEGEGGGMRMKDGYAVVGNEVS